ncbi:PAS domain S-box protein [Kiritimatiellaeota bacterium B1221]|nr:PAS domain S-box protein [Kiritimatiellaeota bacterium B1221]
MNLFQVLTPLTYWLLVSMWGYILWFLIKQLQKTDYKKHSLSVLIFILIIDALRTLFESLYFGAWFTSKSGMIPVEVYEVLSRPEIVIFPKVLNVIAASAIIFILLNQWFPAEKRSRKLNKIQAEESKRKLIESEERFRLIFENAPVLINAFDEKGKCTLWNKHCRETFGWTKDELNTEVDPLRLFYPDPLVYNQVARTVTSEPDGEFQEWRPLTKDGRTLTTSWANFRLPTGLVFSLGHDITHQKLVQSQLQVMNDALENSLNAFDIVNHEGVFTYVNQSYVEMWGYDSAEEILGTSPADHCQDPEQAAIVIRTLLSTGKFQGEFTAKRKDGSTFEVMMYARLAYDNEGQHIFPTTSIDITALKQAKEEVIKERNRLQFAMEVCHTGTWDLDLKDHSARRTLGHDQIFGYHEKVPDWSYEKFLEHVIPEDREEMNRRFLAACAQKSDWNIECRIRRVDGEIRWIWAVGRHSPLINGTAQYMVGVVQDITERKQTEIELQKSHELLEVRVEKRTSELKQQKEEAESLNRAMINVMEDLKTSNKDLEKAETALLEINKELEAFTYSVSHDLRAPLRAIMGFVHILLEDYGTVLDDEGKRIGAVISESAQNMGRLIDDLLSFSRIGRMRMQSTGVDMEELANRSFMEITTPEDRERITFQVNSMPMAVVDRELIHHVWMNLIGNAVKFSSKKDQAIIDVSAEENDDEVIYTVKDNGAGFDPQFAGKLFGVFQRLHTKEEFDGTGVGLAIIQRIIHRHGGRIWAESAVDHGATFHFTIKKDTQHASRR